MDADHDENHDVAVQHLLDTFSDPGRTWADLEASRTSPRR